MNIHLPILLAILLTGAGGAVQAAAVPVVTLQAPQCHAALATASCRIGNGRDMLSPAASHPGDGQADAYAQPGDELQALDEYAPTPASVRTPATDAAPIPEPAQFLMLLAGVILLGLHSTRKEKYDKFSA